MALRKSSPSTSSRQPSTPAFARSCTVVQGGLHEDTASATTTGTDQPGLDSEFFGFHIPGREHPFEPFAFGCIRRQRPRRADPVRSPAGTGHQTEQIMAPTANCPRSNTLDLSKLFEI